MGARIGIQLCITSASVYLLASNPTHDKVGKRRNQFLIGYSVILLILMTFAFSTPVLMGQLMWIEHRDFPGGPLSYLLSHGSSLIVGLGTSIVGNFMGDALLVGEPSDYEDCFILTSASSAFVRFIGATLFGIRSGWLFH